MFPDSWEIGYRLTSSHLGRNSIQMTAYSLLYQTLNTLYFLSCHIFFLQHSMLLSVLCFSLSCLDKPPLTGPFWLHTIAHGVLYHIINIRMTCDEKNLKPLFNLKHFWCCFSFIYTASALMRFPAVQSVLGLALYLTEIKDAVCTVSGITFEQALRNLIFSWEFLFN